MKTKGFTIIELMIIVAMIAILATFAIPNFLAFRCKTVGGNAGLDKDSVYQVCTNCDYCMDHKATSREAIDEIIRGEASFEKYIRVKVNKTITPNPNDTTTIIAPEEVCVNQERRIRELKEEVRNLRSSTQRENDINRVWKH